MKEIYTEIEINTSAEKAWELLTNFPAHSEWNPFVTKIVGEAKMGSILEIYVQVPNGQGMAFKPLIIEFKPNRELRWVGKLLIPGLFTGEHYYIIEPLDSQRIKFIHGEKLTGILVPFSSGVLKKSKQGFELMNQAFKKQLE